ncbi:2-oxo-4-hydroxy-4-carboxy-5-ureidoimidazoline decarboxylase [Flavobacteriales bacterium]|nr:2-oxo-4-hydroxy-4-carboxy-5-ureidoimidazoline decarboxylase [Flavobacteriales bacterium]
MNIKDFNQLPPSKLKGELEKCCVAKKWINGVASATPFTSVGNLIESSNNSWQNCAEEDWLEAFTGHPKIGDLSSLSKKYSNTSDWANNEQSGMNEADLEIIRKLADGNKKYEDKFGFIFIVCATGKTATEMLALLEARLPNNRIDELVIAAAEQHKITQLRLNKLFS